MTVNSQGSLEGNGGDLYLYALHFATVRHVVDFIRPIDTLSGNIETSDLPILLLFTNGNDESHVRGSDFAGLFQPTRIPLDTKKTSHKIYSVPYICYFYYFTPKQEPVACQPVIKSYFYAIIRPDYSIHHINEHYSYTILLIYDTDVLLPHHTSKPGDQTPGYLKNTLTKIDRQPETYNQGKENASDLVRVKRIDKLIEAIKEYHPARHAPGGVFFMEEV